MADQLMIIIEIMADVFLIFVLLVAFILFIVVMGILFKDLFSKRK